MWLLYRSGHVMIGQLVMFAVSSVTYAPFLNGIVALGEEIGWHGFLYPQLKTRF